MSNFVKSTPGIISIVGIIALIFLPFSVGLGIGGSDIQTIMRVVVSLIVLGAGLYIILSNKYPADTQKWAYGIVGLIVGYWLPAISG